MPKEDSFHLGAKALIFNSEQKLLLLKLNPRKFDSYASMSKEIWDLPGGRVNRGETVHEALRREVYEETGINFLKNVQEFSVDLTSIRVPSDSEDVGVIYSTFTCEIEGHASVQLSHEHVDHLWVLPYEAVTLLPSNFPKGLVEKLSAIVSKI